MLKKMQRRFVLAAMAAFGTVMLVIAAGINIVNYCQRAAMQDEMLNGIYEYEQMRTRSPGIIHPPISEMAWAEGPEADFTIRFFAVHCDEAENITLITRDNIFSVDEAMAGNYAKDILGKGRQRGYYENYRYLIKPDEDGTTIVFLNVYDSMRYGQLLLLAVLGLVLLFSQKAIQPYARNIERQKRFITDAGHELKTPLASISTSADIAAMEYEGDEWIANIQKQTARLTKLVGELVTLSRLDEEVPLPEKQVFSFSDAAWEIAEPFTAVAKAEGKKYSKQIEENLYMEGDRNMIQQMLSILLDNAMKYSGTDGEIRMDIYRKRSKVCVEISNSCDLENLTDLNRLFDRFFRPDESRSVNTGGFGIGLSIAQAIVETHGGRITVSRPEERRILFKLTFNVVSMI